MNVRFDMAQVTQAIDNLRAAYPEIAEDDILRADMLEAETDFHGLLAKLVSLSGDAASMAEAIKLRNADLAARKARYERQEEGIRSLMQSLMEKADLQKVTLPEATLSVSWRKPAPMVIDESQLPDEFCKIKRSADMAKIKEAGTLPPGCTMSNGKNVLTIRTK
jgi:predicted nuclease with TOPRIM domain